MTLRGCSKTPHWIARDGMLYLEDLSTKLAQDRGSIGASEEGSHVNNPHATHRQLLSLRRTILLFTSLLIANINIVVFLPVVLGACLCWLLLHECY